MSQNVVDWKIRLSSRESRKGRVGCGPPRRRLPETDLRPDVPDRKVVELGVAILGCFGHRTPHARFDPRRSDHPNWKGVVERGYRGALRSLSIAFR